MSGQGVIRRLSYLTIMLLVAVCLITNVHASFSIVEVSTNVQGGVGSTTTPFFTMPNGPCRGTISLYLTQWFVGSTTGLGTNYASLNISTNSFLKMVLPGSGASTPQLNQFSRQIHIDQVCVGEVVVVWLFNNAASLYMQATATWVPDVVPFSNVNIQYVADALIDPLFPILQVGGLVSVAQVIAPVHVFNNITTGALTTQVLTNTSYLNGSSLAGAACKTVPLDANGDAVVTAGTDYYTATGGLYWHSPGGLLPAWSDLMPVQCGRWEVTLTISCYLDTAATMVNFKFERAGIGGTTTLIWTPSVYNDYHSDYSFTSIINNSDSPGCIGAYIVVQAAAAGISNGNLCCYNAGFKSLTPASTATNVVITDVNIPAPTTSLPVYTFASNALSIKTINTDAVSVKSIGSDTVAISTGIGSPSVSISSGSVTATLAPDTSVVVSSITGLTFTNGNLPVSLGAVGSGVIMPIQTLPGHGVNATTTVSNTVYVNATGIVTNGPSYSTLYANGPPSQFFYPLDHLSGDLAQQPNTMNTGATNLASDSQVDYTWAYVSFVVLLCLTLFISYLRLVRNDRRKPLIE